MRIAPTLLTVLLTITLLGCGDKPAEKPAVGGTPAEKPADAPKATPSAPEGAASPEDMVEKMKALAESKDFGGLIPLVLPEHRAMLTFGLGLMGPMMTIGMGEAMLGFAGGGDEEKAKAAKDKFAVLKKKWEDLMVKYKVPTLEDETMGELMMGEDADSKMAAVNKLLGHIDHAAFIKESMALMESMNDKTDGDEPGSAGGVSTTFPDEFEAPVVEGDTATIRAVGKDEPMTIVKRDGRWFMDFTSMMGDMMK